MKINLLMNNKSGVLNNCLNLDPYGDNQARQKTDITNLDNIVDNGEADEILARDILCYFPLLETPRLIDGWLKKLRKGGKLLIEGTDYEKVCMDVYYGNLNFSDFHDMIYGKGLLKKNCLSLSGLTKYVRENHPRTQVTLSRFDGYNFILELTK